METITLKQAERLRRLACKGFKTVTPTSYVYLSQTSAQGCFLGAALVGLCGGDLDKARRFVNADDFLGSIAKKLGIPRSVASGVEDAFFSGKPEVFKYIRSVTRG